MLERGDKNDNEKGTVANITNAIAEITAICGVVVVYSDTKDPELILTVFVIGVLSGIAGYRATNLLEKLG